MSPIVLLPADIREMSQFVWHVVNEYYLRPLVAIGATPLVLPALGDALDLDKVLSRVDGVLITGARSNVHPRNYGTTPEPAHEPFDEARDKTSLELIRRALASGVPLLAICRGIQELNVALGGTLVAELRDADGHLTHRLEAFKDPEELFSFTHDAQFEPGSGLAEIVGAPSIRVNSAHIQAIDRLAPRLAVEARAADDTIEAVRVTDAPAFAYGVQWHPEAWAEKDRPSAALFEAFGKAMRQKRETTARDAAE